MIVGVLRIELFLPMPLSLKEKRGSIKKILGRCRSRFPVSCAETGLLDLWQRSELAFVMVGNDRDQIRSVFDRIEAEIEQIGVAELCASETDFLDY